MTIPEIRFEASLLKVVTAVLAAAAFCGCAHIDPWNEKASTPSAPDAIYQGEKVPVSITNIYGGAAAEISSDDLIGKAPMTLAECVRLALERNPKTRSSWYAARSAAAGVGEAKSDYFPTLDAIGNGMRGDAAELDAGTDPGVQSVYEAVFSVQYMLFDAGRPARVSDAEAQLRGLNFRHNTTIQDVALAVEEHYYGLFAAQALRDLASETIKQQEQHAALAEGRYKAGTVQRSDVLKAVTEKANAELNAVRAESAVRIGKGRLANAIGLHVTDFFEVAPASEPNYQETMNDLAALLAEAATNRPELQTVMADIDTRRARLKAAQALDWPSVAASGTYGWQDRSFVMGQQEWMAGIGITLPLFTGFENTYAKQRTKADLKKARSDGETVFRGIELEVWTAYSQLIEARQAIDAAQKLVADAEESARVAEGEYKSGTGSIIGLIDAQTAFTSARTRMIQAKLDWHIAVARVERAAGRSLAGPGMDNIKKERNP
ncbi:MAG: TolC family protein [Planctomycetota bacterium]